jgi:hypothetical protein
MFNLSNLKVDKMALGKTASGRNDVSQAAFSRMSKTDFFSQENQRMRDEMKHVTSRLVQVPML